MFDIFFVWSVLYTCVCIMQKQLKSADKKIINYMYGILFRRLFGPTVRINCPGDQGKTFANSRLKAKIFKDL